MGQFRPSSLIPSTLTSDYTVDATVDNIFTCKINGTSPTTKYRLHIMKNDSASTNVYDTNIVTLDTPLYPVNFDGTENQLSVTVPSTSGMINGEEYKWTITSYWSDNDFYESFDNVFKAYATATVAIDSFPSPLTQKQHTFKATVTQAQGVGVERFGWIIKNKTTGEVMVDTITSGNVYSSDVKVSYDGFLNGEEYEIMVHCWMANGTSIQTEYQTITVSYSVEPFESVVTSKQTEDSGVLVQWSNIYYVFGVPSNDDYSYELEYPFNLYYDNVYLKLAAGNSLTYREITGQAINLPSTITHTICFYCEEDNASIYKANGQDSTGASYYLELSQSSGQIWLDINGTKKSIYTIQNQDRFITLSIDPNQVRIQHMQGDLNGLYPSETLYPSDILYPRDQTYSFKEEALVSVDIITNGTFQTFVLSGPSRLRYFWIRVAPIPSDIWTNLLNPKCLPEWDLDTRILATFQNTLSAGNAQSSSEVVGWLVYRQDEDSSTLRFIRENEPERNYLIDYTARNMVSSEYYVFPSFETEIGIPNVSQPFTPKWWSWDLIVCSKYGNDQYYVDEVHKFDLDVSSGQLTNNTQMSVLQNFTPYAKIQANTSNYWSGQLTALLGNCAVTYSDTVAKMNAIKALSNDGKDKFLKDRKGNFWKVRINSAIQEQMTDAYIEQAVNVTLMWMEVGSSAASSVTEYLTTELESIEAKG